ncbi:hypothetical protein [Rothia sp. HMSC065G12]|uniref:hypothetical protein n=1 Tax=Rothia sp. HMSC065G12 TaxID=1739308 RepID=UPI0008A1BDB5|nr:hypothetical protein [Rothia sp. HMSC065G12]OFK72652.1 hypothetical protein HMPREF2804_09280 [Rothia sp. HMSC065G12]
MITAFICNIEIDRGSLNKLKEDWNAGAKPIKTPRREDSNSYYASDAKDRVDNFPTPMLPYIYGINARKDSVIPTRFYKLIDKKIFNIEIKWVDILTVSPDLIKSEEIPAQITLVTDITGPFKEIKDKINKLSRHNKIYEVIEKLNLSGILIPRTQKSSHSSRKKVYHVCYSEFKLQVPDNNIEDINSFEMLSEVFTSYSFATSRNPNKHQIIRWSNKKPNAYYKLSKYWGVYIARHGACYYISPKYKYGISYALGFHLDGFVFILLQEHIIEYYESQMIDTINIKYAEGINLYSRTNNIILLQKEIQENSMRYRFNNHISHTGQHISIMNLIYEVREFKELYTSFTKDIESLAEISSKAHDLQSNRQQGYISKYALYIALLMIVPGVVSGMSDSISIINFIHNLSTPPENTQHQDPLTLFFSIIQLITLGLVICIIYKIIERKKDD